MRIIQLLAAGFAVAAVAGCSSDTTTSAGINAAGQASLSGIFQDMAALSTAGAEATGTTSSTVIIPVACTYSGVSQSFVCPERVTHVGNDVFHMQPSFMLLDASGGAQSNFDVTTTGGVRVLIASTDTITLPPSGNYQGGSYAITRNDDHTVSGLLTTTRTVSGTGTSTSSILGLSEHDTTTNVVLPTAGSTDVLPASGSIVAVGNSSELGASSRTTLTFVGGNSFTITTTSGAMKTCSMDPVTRDVSCN